MKKIEFAFQVLGLLALFMLYVVIEFNHAKIKLPEDNTPEARLEETIPLNGDIAGSWSYHSSDTTMKAQGRN